MFTEFHDTSAATAQYITSKRFFEFSVSTFIPLGRLTEATRSLTKFHRRGLSPSSALSSHVVSVRDKTAVTDIVFRLSKEPFDKTTLLRILQTLLD